MHDQVDPAFEAWGGCSPAGEGGGSQEKLPSSWPGSQRARSGLEGPLQGTPALKPEVLGLASQRHPGGSTVSPGTHRGPLGVAKIQALDPAQRREDGLAASASHA